MPRDSSTSLGMTTMMGAILNSMKNFWLVKQEPSSYSWSDFVAEGQTSWTGVRNYSARNNLRRMQNGDEVLFYHSGDDKAVVGIAKVIRTAYRDSTAKEGDWSTVDLAPVKPRQRTFFPLSQPALPQGISWSCLCMTSPPPLSRSQTQSFQNWLGAG